MTDAPAPHDDDLPPLREVIARHQLSAKKNLGQNFLFDLNLTDKIARAAAPLADVTVVEVGPGPGGLTRSLLANGAKKVIAIERDQRVRPVLDEINAAYDGRLEVIEGDALEVNIGQLADGPIKIVANLPYNIASLLLVKWMSGEDWPPGFVSATLMFQKEVAERIVAPPGSKTFGRLSVLAQWRASATRLFDVPPRAFTPPPKVTSSIVQITPDANANRGCSASALERVTKSAFGQRRKMLRASLKGLFRNAQSALEDAGIEPTLRAEQVDIDGFCRLARILENE